jgi:FkbM family methyltransferase
MDVIYILKDLLACKGDIQMWINHRYKDDDMVMVRRSVIKYVETTEKLKFTLEGVAELGDMMDEYKFDDITSDDVVLDLGANVGGFSIRAAMKAKHVYAVEPLFYRELKENIALNGMQDKITVLTCAIGVVGDRGNSIELSYRDHHERVTTHTLSAIRNVIGVPITFLKIDIEGAEWTINPKEFDGIPKIEFEVHYGNNTCMPVNQKVLDYIKENWITEENHKWTSYDSYWIHARKKGVP